MTKEKTEWDALRENARARHATRVSKNTTRTCYADSVLRIVRQYLQALYMDFEVKNEATGQIVIKLSTLRGYNKTIVFYAGTGKIVGYPERGIDALESLILDEDRRWVEGHQ